MTYRTSEKRKEYERLYKKKNKVKIAEQQKEYQKKNKEKIKQQKKEYAENNKEKIKIVLSKRRQTVEYKKQKRQHMMRARTGLTDYYIKMLIIANSTIKCCEVPKELIELKRTEKQMKRYLEEISQ